MRANEIELTRYSDFRPSQFDTKGLGCDSQQDWFVAPCSVTRDSGALDRSNWDAQLEAFEALDADAFEVHRFGHWGPGWFEIVLVKPDS